MKMEALHVVHGEILQAIHEECFDESWSVEAFQNLLGLPATFGYLMVSDEGPKGFILCQGDGLEAEIITIATRKQNRRSGIGRCLLEKVLGQTGRLFLEVARDNPGAIAFYEHLGFAQIGVRKNYYKRSGDIKVDALVMEKASFKPDD